MKAPDPLWLHLKEVPAFRALLRGVEARFYQGLEMPEPVLDLGCGDGHFATIAFPGKVMVGLDPERRALREAAARRAYRWVVQADGARMPFPAGFFRTVISNSVLEHIPDVEAVLQEVARVLRPGGYFLFCSPSHRFVEFLSVYRLLRRLGLGRAAEAYGRLFNRISRHYHCDAPEVWASRLGRAGLRPLRWWFYFSRSATALLEWGHPYGLPSLIYKRLFGRWILAPWRWSLWPVERVLRPFYAEPPGSEGAYFFMIARREGAE
ncbi:class I SAM-dependent methyltransferase [Thermoflexus sp.]|uniref:class I SAM-dependent methyltransferase n=1 Tax=Thermoflexus sp. TaxID=1969742 RepID=UPI0035E43984